MTAAPRSTGSLFRKIVAALILVPLAIVIIAFAVANRQVVTVSLDPFSAERPAASLTLPLFALVIVLLILGVVIGGVAACATPNGGAWRGGWNAKSPGCMANWNRCGGAPAFPQIPRRQPRRPRACSCGRRFGSDAGPARQSARGHVERRQIETTQVQANQVQGNAGKCRFW